MLPRLVCCVKMAAKFDFSFSENYGFVKSFEKVEKIIRDHELDTTTKSALLVSEVFAGKNKGPAFVKNPFFTDCKLISEHM